LKTVSDNGKTISVVNCSTKCVNIQLRNISLEIVDAAYVDNVVDYLLVSLDNLVEGFSSGKLRDEIGSAVCAADSGISTPLWIGVVLVLAGVTFIAFSLLAVDRGLWCCKEGVFDEEVYTELKEG